MTGINRVAFRLFGFPVYWYGLVIAAGMLLGVLLAAVREKRYGQPRDTALNFILVAIPAALVCARLYYVAFSWESYASHPLEIFNIRNGGMAIYGGVIGGILAGWIYSRKTRTSMSVLADLCAPALALGQAIGRWGNFFNQEAYGIQVTFPSLMFFPMSVYIEAASSWHYATFFYESVWCFLITAVLLTGEKKRCFRRSGDVFLWYALLYAAERMVVEGLRTDSLYFGDIRISQLLSALLLIILVSVFVWRAFRSGKRPWPAAILFASLALTVPVSLICLPVPLQALHALALAASAALLYRYTERKR